MSAISAFAHLRLRQALRADLDSGRPRWTRYIRRPLVMALVLVFVGVQIYSFASSWVADHIAVAHPILVSLMLPALTALGSASAIVIFFYAFNNLITSFTDGRALQFLLLTPLRPQLILGERILTTSLGFSVLLVATIPALFAVGTLGLPASYYVAVVVAILLLPVVPTCLAVLVLLPLLRWLPPTRARTIATLIGTACSLTFFIGTREIASRSTGALPSLPEWLPTAWPGRFVAAAGLGDTNHLVTYGVLMVGVNVLAFAAATLAAARVFVTGSGSYNSVRRRNRRRVPARVSERRSTSRRPSWWPIFIKDWRTLRRDPQRLISLLYPLAIVAFNAFQLLSRGSMRNTNAAVGTSVGLLMVACLILVGSATPAFINGEGRMLTQLALTPVKPAELILSKWTISSLVPLLLVEGALGGLTIYLGFGIGETMLLATTFAALTVTLSGVTLATTMLWPKFNATSAQGRSGGFASIVTLAFGGALCAGTAFALFAGLFFWHGTLAAVAIVAMFATLILITFAVWAGAPMLFARLVHSPKVLRSQR